MRSVAPVFELSLCRFGVFRSSASSASVSGVSAASPPSRAPRALLLLPACTVRHERATVTRAAALCGVGDVRADSHFGVYGKSSPRQVTFHNSAPQLDNFQVVISDAASRAGADYLRQKGVSVRETGPLSPELLQEQVDADAIIVASSTKVTQDYMQKCARLKVVGRAGAGLDNIDTEFAARSGIKVVRAGEGLVSAASVAEMAFLHMLSLLRSARPAHESIAANTWRRRDFVGNSLTGKRLGIVGLGRIGKQVAAMAKAFGMEVSALARAEAAGASAQSKAQEDVPRLQWDEFLRKSDIITIHCPLTEQTRNLFDAAAFAKMKDTAIVVNCGRGGIVDEDALLQALQSGGIAAAGLDVLRKEGGELESHVLELAKLPNCLITPHLGSSTHEAAEEVALQVAEAVFQALEQTETADV